MDGFELFSFSLVLGCTWDGWLIEEHMCLGLVKLITNHFCCPHDCISNFAKRLRVSQVETTIDRCDLSNEAL